MHIAEIYGFYVSADHRGKGVDAKVFQRTLKEIILNKRIIKVNSP